MDQVYVLSQQCGYDIGDRLDSESPAVASFSCPTRRTRQFEGPDLVAQFTIVTNLLLTSHRWITINPPKSLITMSHDESWCTWMHLGLRTICSNSPFLTMNGFIGFISPKPTAVGPGLRRASLGAPWSAMEPCKTWDVSTLVSPNLPRRRQLHFRCAMKNQEICQEKLDNPKTMEVSRNLIGLCHSLTSNLIII